MDPTQVKTQINQMFMDILSQVSGGVFHDLTTVITAMLVIAVVVLGIDIITDVLVPNWQSERAKNKLWAASQNAGLDWDKVKNEENLHNACKQWRKQGRDL